MSKLADAIRRTARTESPQIGFAPAPTKPKPSMLVVALVDSSATRAEGADLVIVKGSSEQPPAAPSNGQSGSIRGLWLQDGSGDATTARQQGYEVVVFGIDEAPASVLLEEEAGLVMHVQEDLPDSLLQALQWLPLDALMVRWDGTVTVRRQLELQRLSGFSRKPLILVVENEPRAAELEALREVGVIGVVADLTSPGGDARLKELRTTVDSLRPRPRRSRGEAPTIAIAPAAAITMPAEPDHDDDDDDFE